MNNNFIKEGEKINKRSNIITIIFMIFYTLMMIITLIVAISNNNTSSIIAIIFIIIGIIFYYKGTIDLYKSRNESFNKLKKMYLKYPDLSTKNNLEKDTIYLKEMLG